MSHLCSETHRASWASLCLLGWFQSYYSISPLPPWQTQVFDLPLPHCVVHAWRCFSYWRCNREQDVGPAYILVRNVDKASKQNNRYNIGW